MELILKHSGQPSPSSHRGGQPAVALPRTRDCQIQHELLRWWEKLRGPELPFFRAPHHKAPPLARAGSIILKAPGQVKNKCLLK
jgi:hypothetical protein